MRKLASSPDFLVGSVHAVTEQGQVLVACGGGSQVGSYASGAGTVIWVVGAHQPLTDLYGLSPSDAVTNCVRLATTITAAALDRTET
jgi:hypothetical protein